MQNKICAIYFDEIGKLKIDLVKSDLNSSIKIYHKCEDGRIKIKLKSEEEHKNDLNIFFSKSLRVNFKETKIYYSKKGISVNYSVTKRLIDRENLMDKISLMNIFDCFNESKINKKRGIESIRCLNCENILVNLDKNKPVYNFNYDCMNNLDSLSCHESLSFPEKSFNHM